MISLPALPFILGLIAFVYEPSITFFFFVSGIVLIEGTYRLIVLRRTEPASTPALQPEATPAINLVIAATFALCVLPLQLWIRYDGAQWAWNWIYVIGGFAVLFSVARLTMRRKRATSLEVSLYWFGAYAAGLGAVSNLHLNLSQNFIGRGTQVILIVMWMMIAYAFAVYLRKGSSALIYSIYAISLPALPIICYPIGLFDYLNDGWGILYCFIIVLFIPSITLIERTYRLIVLRRTAR